MAFKKLLALLRKPMRRSGNDALNKLPAPDQLRRFLERERARADRTGKTLAVLAFLPHNQETFLETLVCLAKILKERVRSTDDFGWLDEQQIAAVLPSTPAEGAWRVADDVCLAFPDDLTPPLCTVYTYPSEEKKVASGKNGTSGQGKRPTALALDKLFVQPMPLWKRTVDVVGAAVGLLLLLPLLCVVSLAIKLTSSGPLFFTQLRAGRGGKPFLIYKFRSMVVDAAAKQRELLSLNEQEGPVFKIKKDPRVTALGRFLRKSSLDELPQLWNVLMGDMSLVGPRPLAWSEAQACSGWRRWRLDVRPGLTCIWQVRGRSLVAFADWMRMDLQYVRTLSLKQDLKLLVLTVPAVILGKGAQ